ncbi:hypothetical protein OE88DRAFT_1237884 [Heliocybe sulcata]|uniref:Uncharacterized protein n=1 Tax=Heliocybe sulcata TaxID=5364 RepID=A0A5C3N640_9AGAM|nr:hypothetical protein OE88DRAFT_1237884 [Heliocybe sulcata]
MDHGLRASSITAYFGHWHKDRRDGWSADPPEGLHTIESSSLLAIPGMAIQTGSPRVMPVRASTRYSSPSSPRHSNPMPLKAARIVQYDTSPAPVVGRLVKHNNSTPLCPETHCERNTGRLGGPARSYAS